MNWWENDFVNVGDNVLCLGGEKAGDLAKRYGTPLYVYGKDRILSQYGNLERAFAESDSFEARIYYAMKANPHPGILSLLQKRGAWIDAVSPNEVEAALAVGFAPERILFTGTSVSLDDLRRVFPIRGLTINIDAAEELELMGELKLKEFPRQRIRVSVRWNP